LAFSKRSRPEWNRRLFEQLALPWMLGALRQNRYSLALYLEHCVYGEFVMQTETEQHFAACFSRWLDPMRAAGRRVASALPAPPDPGRSPPVIGFFLHSSEMLAHTQVMAGVLEGLSRSGISPPFVARVYVLSNPSPRLAQRLAGLGIPLVRLDRGSADADAFRRLLRLREELIKDQTTALVWVSTALFMPFAFALRLAPVQIWWAMKYHSLEFPEIDGYVTNSSVERYKQIGNRLWRAGRGSFPHPYDPSLQPEAQRIRARYSPPFTYLLGCFGREEKLNHPAFLEAVIKILRAHPEAAFLWTGRSALPAIQERFEAAGVTGQCFFIGWVDTKLYAQVIDLFLDSFPFPCGLTLIEAMAAGKPFVSLLSDESRETGTHALIHALLHENRGSEQDRRLAHEAFRGGELYFCATDPGQYVEMAERLLGDAALREQAGAAARHFAAEFYQDQRASAEGFAQHFLEIIAEKRPH
jgi:glycosyltransferase involved in cell wall biosynthesis